MSDDTPDLFITTTENGRDSPPQVPMDSPGSSASSRLKDEYSQLLKYTIESTPGLNSLRPLLQDTSDGNRTGHGAELDEDAQRHDSNLNRNSSQDLGDESDYNYKGPALTPCGRSDDCIQDPVNAMSSKLCGWLATLKDNILEELKATLEASQASQKQEHLRASEHIQSEKASLQKDVNKLTEQIHGLEHSLQQKCTLVKNLTDSLVAQKKRVEVAKHFYHWKADHQDKQREIFTQKLAVQHHERKLNLRVLKAWYGMIQTRWRGRVERKSQTQAKEMCMSLSSDYETKVSTLNEKISALEKKVSLLQAEREMYSEQVKKAFMRGMCALNMETMSVFGEDQLKQNKMASTVGLQEVSTLDSNTLMTSTLDEDGGGETQYPQSSSNVNAHLPSATAVLDTMPSSSGSRSHLQQSLSMSAQSPTRSSRVDGKQQQQLRQSSSTLLQDVAAASHHPSTSAPGYCPYKAKSNKTRPKPAKSQNNNKAGTVLVGPAQVLAPPMASVVVERHPAVNKQTMGKATAIRFPKKKNCESVPTQYITPTTTTTATNSGSGMPRHKFVGDLKFKPLAGQDHQDKNDNRYVTDSYIKVVD